MDLVCGEGSSTESGNDPQIVVRAKLRRDVISAGVCLSEAVSHAVLDTLDLPVAEAFAVTVGDDFARDLSVQCGFDPPVIPGRHWGTRRLQMNVQEIECSPDLIETLSDPLQPLRIFLADVLLANPDRRTMGNVLYARESGSEKYFLIPIDQSDCFGHPRRFTQPGGLDEICERQMAAWLEGTEAGVMDSAPRALEREFRRIEEERDSILSCVEAPPEEWYDATGISPEAVQNFLTYRIDHFADLARQGYWNDLTHFGEVSLFDPQ